MQAIANAEYWDSPAFQRDCAFWPQLKNHNISKEPWDIRAPPDPEPMRFGD